jgi:diguanylate cyclase (GGDEF)-like protein/PAS domain S-box-containing protein
VVKCAPVPPRPDVDALRLEIRRLRRRVSRLRAAAATYREIVHRTNSIVLRWDPDGHVIFLNDFGLRLFGYKSEEVVGRSVLGLIVPDTESSGRDLVAMIHDLLRHPERYRSNENENVTRDGRRVWITWRNTPIVDGRGRLVEIISTGIDTTDRKAAEEALRESEGRFRALAVRDDLTGLYNTRHLYEALDALIASSAAAREPFSVLFIDLDRFKRVVDARGHLNGSRVIQDVAATIQACLAAPAWAVAYAGDEFVVVLPGLERPAALEKAEEIRARIAATAYLAATGRPIRLTASFGVACYPDDANDLETLLSLGDQALFAVKRRGRDGVAAAGARVTRPLRGSIGTRA